jgi:superfamily II DNA/RNA helicase
MDRALDIERLTAALGTHPRLPTPTELQRLLAETEVALFAQQAELDETFLDTAWYLQSIATARDDLQLFPLDRRRVAHQVSAHIFDLALQGSGLQRNERLRYTFASQIGYLGGDLTPNAAALARRAPLPVTPYPWLGPGVASLEAGILLLALNRAQLFPLLQARRRQLSQFSQQLGDLHVTAYGAVNLVIAGVWDLTNYLTYGSVDLLGRARQAFQDAMANVSASNDVDSRWVASHLHTVAEATGQSSVWAILPPDQPSAARSLSLGDPPVLLLWPPQMSFLQPEAGVSPLDSSIKRLVLSFPTSAGKTLLAQIFVLSHLVSSETDVCVVAPTHSLCRELSLGLQRRLRTLGYQLYEDGPLGLYQAKPPVARVVVMTPEKLAARLRNDPSGLLSEFGMFVVDEAHLVADGDRGWRLEETVSVLHHLTKNTDHRLMLLSAALGNQAHVVAWIDNGRVISKHEDWRGPRRLTVIYTSDLGERTDEPARGNRRPRRSFQLLGTLRLKAPGGQQPWVGRQFSDPVGQLIQRLTNSGEWVRDDRSTTQREQLVPLVLHVAAFGPVLVVEATRTEAQRLAHEISDRSEEFPSPPLTLIETIRSRLGGDHPLVAMLMKGVAFHHSALPDDIQAEIENAVRNGQVRCLVATTTLTEGVNLPFKTVIVAHRGYQTAEGYVELVDDSKLLNAIGRAGRAGRETEGWLVLSQLGEAFRANMFDDLDRSGADVELHSTLVSEAALEALTRLEERSRDAADVILSDSEEIADGFISYVWFIADALEELNGSVTEEAVLDAIRDTLAWHQLNDARRDQLLRVARSALSVFIDQPEQRRRRWARAGTSLPTAALLETITDEVHVAYGALDGDDALLGALRLILAEGRLARLLSVNENRTRAFKPYRTAPRDRTVDVDINALIEGWVSGTDLQSLADEHLSQIDDVDYRYEQLSEFIAGVFEHHLPWMLGIIIAWVNRRFEEDGRAERLPEELPGAIHFGVSSSQALGLMLGGVRSRRLANLIAQLYSQAVAGNDAPTLRDWLALFDVAHWRNRFDATPTELLDLLAYTRAPEARIVSEVLSGEAHTMPIDLSVDVEDGTEAEIRPDPEQPEPAALRVTVDDSVVGTVGTREHDDVALLREIGIPIAARVVVNEQRVGLEIRMIPDTT